MLHIKQIIVAMGIFLAISSGFAKPVVSSGLSSQAIEKQLDKANVHIQTVGETVHLVANAALIFIACSANPAKQAHQLVSYLVDYVRLFSPEMVSVAVYADPKSSPQSPRVSQALMQKRSEIMVQLLMDHGLHAPIIVASGDQRYLKAKKAQPFNPLSYNGLVVIDFKKHPTHWANSQ